MAESHVSAESYAEVPSRYRVHLLSDVKPTERGVVYRRGDEHFLLAWDAVKRVMVAEVGEHEGVATIVFDLAVQIEGPECVVCRFDAELGEEAQTMARAVELGVGRDRCGVWVREAAIDGWPSRNFPDLESFEEAALESIRFG